MTRGLEIDTFAALARTRGDIHYPSWEKLDHYPSSLFPYKLKLQRFGNNVGISLFHFESVSLRLAVKYLQTRNSHTKQNILKVHRLNYILMSNESSLVLFLAHGESQNLHVKMDKIHDQPGLNCTARVVQGQAHHHH